MFILYTFTCEFKPVLKWKDQPHIFTQHVQPRTVAGLNISDLTLA